MKAALGGDSVRRLMITDFRALQPVDTLQRAIDLTLATAQRDFPVVEGDRVTGVLTQAALIRGLAADGREGPVSKFMEHDFQLAETLGDDRAGVPAVAVVQLLDPAGDRCGAAGRAAHARERRRVPRIQSALKS